MELLVPETLGRREGVITIVAELMSAKLWKKVIIEVIKQQFTMVRN